MTDCNLNVRTVQPQRLRLLSRNQTGKASKCPTYYKVKAHTELCSTGGRQRYMRLQRACFTQSPTGEGGGAVLLGGRPPKGMPTLTGDPGNPDAALLQAFSNPDPSEDGGDGGEMVKTLWKLFKQ